MADNVPYKISTISEYHSFRGLPAPEHPLVSVINFDDIQLKEEEPESLVCGFYTIALKRHPDARLKYGQQEYDFNEGVMLFMAPGQVFGIRKGLEERPTGWMLMLHPDYLWNTRLATAIKHYEYFDYAIHEALFLSKKEEESITGIFQIIRQEYHTNIDNYSHNIIIAQLELLLSYSERFYNRQFITRSIASHKILEQLEEILNGYFTKDSLIETGIPTVQGVAEKLHVSPKYLSSLLKNLTGQNTQQHIHHRLIEKAKEKLSTTGLSVSEIAFQLGFEHSQSFSRLFKMKTKQSPMEFRASFN
ncbi:AraC family transcriptional regulator [Sinomicrobium pectinilyticum]|uniref:AraC family transcriptional regulator n=1 Tax=Sinomicrobium pectinilyticum TaxID=1084421 RepID=A0A3N0ERB0_SINP1|nr:helix-turn-helix transcriptional regulator [Sinomicrobium pectinilyticum]RNL90393.1 AraC family transcriptional regulator [Sinomicrobium pectinilyticum]